MMAMAAMAHVTTAVAMSDPAMLSAEPGGSAARVPGADDDMMSSFCVDFVCFGQPPM